MSAQPPRDHADELAAWRGRGENYAGAIYGLILVASVLTVYREETNLGPGLVAATVVVTSLVFWLAHVYSELLAFRISFKRNPSWRDVRAALHFEWPIVESCLLPVVALLLGTFKVFGGRYAVTLALVICLAELAGFGVYSARRGGATGLVALGSGAIALALGLVVVGLKVFVQH